MFKTGWISLLLLATCTPLAVAETWGDLKMQFKVAGKVPTPKKIKVNAGVPFCGPLKLVDEYLVIGPEQELANVFVYLVTPADEKVPVCPDLPAPDPTASLEIKNCRFAPHTLVMQTSQKLVIGNQDPIGHHSKGDFLSNGLSFNDLIPAKGNVAKTFAKTENLPMSVGSSLHGWMKGIVLVRDNPYAAISDAKGMVTIPKVPVGTWTFVVWHESCGYFRAPIVNGASVVWPKGRVDIPIEQTGTDFGLVELLLVKNR